MLRLMIAILLIIFILLLYIAFELPVKDQSTNDCHFHSEQIGFSQRVVGTELSFFVEVRHLVLPGTIHEIVKKMAELALFLLNYKKVF